ncbi:uncharacterized protein LOC123877394 isoform X2 [Maniola jurtina]|uniref:uncharacterized protein LOC123877394 isoform X1 n=2 Tax=Maniola jurtina TaxID=191418 RepID=UPI001E68B8A0|nr:uncharacterized protein LOC123877394 isoform X1 [Maniola jurtina]XP_045780087.1 uncharacterized protein LOC123877394 isoform X2 [Maniola jurtina]
MYIHYTLGAIFIVFILCVHCDNGVTNNEILEIYVPSAPQNITANRVTTTEIHLLWAPPITYTIHRRSNPVDTTDRQTSKPESEPNLTVIAKEETQADEPKVPIDPIDDHLILDTPINQERPKDDYTYNLYRNDERKYNNQFSESDILYRTKRDERSWNDRRKYNYQFPDLNNLYRSKRDTRSHRHRKRRQDSVTEKINFGRNDGIETHQAFELPIEVVKKSMTVPLRKDITQIAYVLYYEEGVTMKKGGSDFLMVSGVQTSEQVKRKNVFRSDLGIQDYLNATKNLTLLNTSGAQSSKLVGFRLRNLKPFTPYKIWVRAFYNFPLEGVMSSDLLERLGPQGESLYVLTDVRPPSAPVILNLTCEQPSGILYLQWRQPREYDNSLDQYVVTLRKIPEQQPRTRLTLPTTKDDIETTISVKVELWNVTRYEVKIYAVTQSVATPNTLINGSESPPQEVSSELCTAHSEAMSPADISQVKQTGSSLVALVAAALLTILAAVSAALVYWRCRSRVSKCISAAYNYLEEGGERAARAPLNTYKKPVVNCSPLVSCAGGNGAAADGPAAARPPRMAGSAHPLVRARQFPAHVAALHADGDIGFSKEYEIVVSKSAALGHTSHHSYRPENRLKNRYLNITAYDHSRVCVSSGGRCGAAGCVGAGRGASCDYVNANFIDGMLPALSAQAAARIERKLERRNRPNRQPSVKASKPPPNLAEGIESAFLNIEFSGIVESEDQAEDSDSERSDDDSELDDVYVDINGVPRQIKLEWAVWRRRYIATQGPTPATLDAFWRMIWQHRVHTLVMITNLVERGRRKCDMYWPAGGRGSSADFGGIHVTLLYEDVRAAYTVRHLRVRGKPQPITIPQGSESSSESSTAPTTTNNEGRHIVQYHYTVWPDHGTPRHPLAVLPFVRAAADPGTVLVHCSAGVGRTGTYIVIDAQLNQLKLTGTLSPLGFLCRARTQRNHLVQTEEQYVFVHDALLEYVRSGNTEVEFTKAREYLAKLLEPISDEELAVMDLNPPKRKSVNDLTNGNSSSHNGNNLKNDVSSLKSVSQSVSEQIVENGSQASIKTDELNTESKSSDQEKDGLVNGGDDVEGVYDLAPRSTDTYSKKMQAYNNMNEQEKEEMRRVNRAENYALLERMRSLSNRHQLYQGPPPVNLLEKQFQLITRSCVEPSVCARAVHNADKNRPGGILPSDSARVMLVPKPGVEGSEYVNASWVCGRRRMREYAVAQHPGDSPELWRLLWDHTAQLVLLLADNPTDPDCDVFWPTEEENELFVANFRASFVSKDTYVAYRRSERKTQSESPTEPETNGYRRTEGSECADDERLIPENTSPANDSPEPAYRFDRTELRLERLSGNRDLSARKSIANGDLFSSLSEKKNGPKSPRSPSKMSLKNFKLSSPTKFKFPEWGSRTAGSPPDTAPPPPPIAPSLTVQEEAELRRPVYVFERVNSNVPEVSSDRVIEVTNVSVHSLQDDYQLSVKFIKCSGWLDGHTSEYTMGRPDDNECVRAVRQASCASEREEAINRLIAPFEDSFALVEFVAACQMEYKNGPVVVVDKYGGWRALTFCSLSAACGGVRNPAISEPGAEFAPPCTSADLYCSSALNAHSRCAPNAQAHNCASPHGSGSLSEVPQAHSPKALLAAYSALAAYAHKLPRPDS